MDVYYFRKNLEARPQLNDTVEEDLPLECAVLSDQGIHLDSSLLSSSVVSLLSPDTTTDTTSVTPTNQPTTQTRRNTKKNKVTAKSKQQEQFGTMVAGAIKDFADKHMNSKVAESTVKCMLSDKASQENDEIQQGRDDAHQENEELRCGREEIRCEKEHK
jgi:hypothetical protein